MVISVPVHAEYSLKIRKEMDSNLGVFACIE